MDDNQYNCDHKWKSKMIEGGVLDGTSACSKCGLVLNNANRLQLEMNRHNLGLQKRLQILSLVISVVALIVSLSVAYCK